MKRHRSIELTATPEKISYTALVAAITEKLKNSGEYIECENISSIKSTLNAAEKKGL